MAEAVAEAEEEFHRATKELEVAAGKLATAEPAEKAEFVYQLELAEARLHEAEEAVVDAKVNLKLAEFQAAGGAPTSTVPPEMTTLAPSSTVPPEIANLAPSTTTQ